MTAMTTIENNCVSLTAVADLNDASDKKNLIVPASEINNIDYTSFW